MSWPKAAAANSNNNSNNNNNNTWKTTQLYWLVNRMNGNAHEHGLQRQLTYIPSSLLISWTTTGCGSSASSSNLYATSPSGRPKMRKLCTEYYSQLCTCTVHCMSIKQNTELSQKLHVQTLHKLSLVHINKLEFHRTHTCTLCTLSSGTVSTDCTCSDIAVCTAVAMALHS